ncbi:MAG TPA: TolC family protein [Holophagaceae bacterium]|nr:TolC family protein [Holophagaceae bacterium]
MRRLPLGWAAPGLMALAQAPSPVPHPTPELDRLIQEALERHPDLARSAAQARMAAAQEGQARALPDPEVSLGVERSMAGEVTVPDTMGGMPIMARLEPMTQKSLMVSQGLPWPGKRDARGREARAQATAAEAELSRVRLDLIQQLKATWLEGQALQAKRDLLERESQVLTEAEALAQSHYAHGQGSQAEVLQAGLERSRLAQRKVALEVELEAVRWNLNRLAGREPEAPLPPLPTLGGSALPGPISASEALDSAGTRSPELQAARARQLAAQAGMELARLERRPDIRVGAGLMRGTMGDTGWKAEVGFTLPFGRRTRAMSSQRNAEGLSADAEVRSVQSLLALRTRERAARLEALRATVELLESRVLPQDEALVESAQAQVEAGRGALGPLLEAIRGRLRDRGEALDLRVQAQQLALAQEALSLAPSAGLGTGSGPMAVPEAAGAAPASAPTRSSTSPATSAAAQPMKM